MDEIVEGLQSVIETKQELKAETLQKILLIAKEYRNSDKNIILWKETVKLLWDCLKKEFKKIDDQLLCSICFFTTVTYTDDCPMYINKLLNILSIDRKSKKENDSYIISLMYGLFQSNFLTHCTENTPHCDVLLQAIFNVLMVMVYEYTQYTYLTFKIIKSFKQVCNTKWKSIIYTKDNQIKLINVINHNWENPITGVRDLLKSIFNTTLGTLDEETYLLVLKDVNQFYWNKAKYLMLCEFINIDKKNISILMSQNDWAKGIFSSLNIPSLVSAGADTYFAILKRLQTEEEWCNIFLNLTKNLFYDGTEKEIQNFSNYWCLTTLKKFPSLLNVFVDKIMNYNFENKLYILTSVVKQGNRLGIFKKDWEFHSNSSSVMNLVAICLDHKMAQLRMTAFDIVCVSHNKSLPQQIEYRYILNYLKNNMNSDCTLLRLHMIGSLKCFLNQLHALYLNYITKTSTNNEVADFICFCKNLQDIIMESLILNGNYQRKITAVKLTYLIMECLSEVHRKKKNQTRQTDASIINFLKVKQQWILSGDKKVIEILIILLKDPSDDVRETVVQLLLKYYSDEIQNTNILNSITTDALRCMKSKFFYISNCGQSMLKLLGNLLIARNINIKIESKFKNIEDLFYYGYNELLFEYKNDIMTSIANARQLHSFINILIVVLEVCIQNSYQIQISRDIINDLINVLQHTTNQFTVEQGNSTSSDFAKMSDMVEDLIAQSEYPCNKDGEVQISGLHQIVLNCLWLNVKASCDFASLLVQYNKDDFETCKKCLDLITHVLDSSRHKGAIEAAGTVLGKVVQSLTSSPEDSQVLHSTNILLKSKLNDLISKAHNMASITRRGAGLSIMVHRIISNDLNKGKPLFHYFVKNVLKLCNSVQDVPTLEDNNIVLENEMDLPKAIYIHFLTKIVNDSSLACDTIYYASELSELAFSNLTSEHWQIRNAALQLYGALIPRLIGQKKSTGMVDGTIATVACDELHTHCPRLWQMITNRLQADSQSKQIVAHSNLVPILNLLASCAKRYILSFDLNTQANEEILTSLIKLLGSPIYIVRRLSAKSVSNIYKFEDVFKLLSKREFDSENFIHGTLLVIKNYVKEALLDIKLLNMLKERLEMSLTNGKHSYINKQCFEDTFCNNLLGFKDIEETFSVLQKKMHEPGIYHWVDSRLQRYFHLCSWFEIPNLLKMITTYCEDHDKYLGYLLLKIKNDNNIPEQILLDITSIGLNFDKKLNSSCIWQIFFEVSLRTDLTKNTNILSFLNNIENLTFSYKLRYTLPLLAKVVENLNENVQLHLSNIIWRLTDPEKMDVDLRHIAALANNKIADVFTKLPQTVQVNSLKSAIILLQDEDEDVRNLSVTFYTNLKKESSEKQCFICLQRLMEKQFLKKYFCDENLKIILDDLSEVLDNVKSRNKDEFNPFSNDTKNIYLEIDVFREFLNNLCL